MRYRQNSNTALLSNNQLLKDINKLTGDGRRRSVLDLVRKGNFPSDIDFEPEEADKFFDVLWDQTKLKNNVRIIKMTTEKKDLRSLNIPDDILYPNGVFAPDKYFSEVTHDKHQLIVKKARGAAFIHDDDLENNFEGKAFVDHFMRMVTNRIANQLEVMFWIGQLADSPTVLNEMLNGWRYQLVNGDTAGDEYYNNATGGSIILDATTDDFDLYAIGAHIAEINTSAPYNTEYKFHNMLCALDPKYQAYPNDLRFLTHPNIIRDYQGILQERGTQLGDKVITGEAPMQYSSVPIIPVPLMPYDIDANGLIGGSGTTTDVVLTPFNNLVIGYLRELRLEMERRPEDEATAAWFSIRTDCNIIDIHNTVLLKNVALRKSPV